MPQFEPILLDFLNPNTYSQLFQLFFKPSSTFLQAIKSFSLIISSNLQAVSLLIIFAFVFTPKVASLNRKSIFKDRQFCLFLHSIPPIFQFFSYLGHYIYHSALE